MPDSLLLFSPASHATTDTGADFLQVLLAFGLPPTVLVFTHPETPLESTTLFESLQTATQFGDFPLYLCPEDAGHTPAPELIEGVQAQLADRQQINALMLDKTIFHFKYR